VKRGFRFVHGDIELLEKLGRNDPCPCGSGRRFQGVLSGGRPVSTAPNAMIITGEPNPLSRWERGNGSREIKPRKRGDD